MSVNSYYKLSMMTPRLWHHKMESCVLTGRGHENCIEMFYEILSKTDIVRISLSWDVCGLAKRCLAFRCFARVYRQKTLWCCFSRNECKRGFFQEKLPKLQSGNAIKVQLPLLFSVVVPYYWVGTVQKKNSQEKEEASVCYINLLRTLHRCCCLSNNQLPIHIP